MEKEKSFVKCELKFIIFLILGISLLNIVGILFQYTFISIVISVIIFCFYMTYFPSFPSSSLGMHIKNK